MMAKKKGAYAMEAKVSAIIDILKAFQMIKMLPDNAFHFFLIGLLSNKLLIID